MNVGENIPMKKALSALLLLVLSMAIVGTAAAQPRRTPTAPARPEVTPPPDTIGRYDPGALVTPEAPSRPGDVTRTHPERPTAVSSAVFNGLPTEDIMATLHALDPNDVREALENTVEGLTEAQLTALTSFLSEIELTLTEEQIAALQTLLEAYDVNPEHIAAVVAWLQSQGYSLSEDQIASLGTLLAGGSVALSAAQIDTIILVIDEYADLSRAELIALELYLESLSLTLTPEQIASLEAFLISIGVEL
ncbi:MAG: hypothetical protein OHK0046_41080 [Anaerolineae bacterium]